jgi:hypothetical protein
MYIMLKHFGLIGMIVFLATVLAIAAANWQGADMSIGQYVASSTESMTAFGVVNTMTAMLISFCLLGYIGPRWRLGNFFTMVGVTLSVCLFTVGWLPQAEHVATDLHQLVAWGAVWLVMLTSILLLIKTWRQSSRSIKICGLVFLAFVLAMMLAWLLNPVWYENHVFFMEVLYFVIFFVFVSMLNYTPVKSPPQED